MMGFMSNLLVFNTELGGDPTFVELLERVRETSLGAYAHQDIPFELLVQDLQPERSVDRPAIFQVSFNYMLKYSAPSVNLSDLTLRLEFLYSGGTPFEITVNMWEAEDGLKGLIEYCTELFHHSTITRLVGHFRTLMENIVSNPQQCINEISLLTRSERDQLLMEWNDTATQYPRDLCVSQVFEQQAGKTPGAVALEFNDVRLTYREVDERTNQIARYLRDLGVGPEMPAGVCLRRSPELVLVLLGILKAGGAYLPLDATYPAERISFMLEDAHSQILITEREFRDKLPASTIISICIDEEWSTIAAASVEALPAPALPENLAYIIYTSGSTGTPKGVGVVHRNIVRLVRETDYAAMGPEEVFLLYAPVSFDASTFEIWAALLNGAKLVICPEQNLSLAELGQILKQHSVTTLWLTAGLFHLMVDEHLDDLSGLHQLLAGGDVLSVPHVQRVVGNMDCRMINGYGPTENTTFSCCYTVADGNLSASVPIGKPIANSEAYILDSNMQPVPIGTTGELYLGGEGLARGYVGQPGMTAEKFVPHPHSTSLGVRLYRTGDWVRFRSTGELEFVGRRDGQVKIRGFRIELGEIERVLMQHGAVREAVVIAREEKLSDKQLVAYIVTDVVEIDTFIEELTESLKQHLPAYMIPSSFMPLVQLPLTANGKVDRAALPAPDEHRREQLYVAPRTETEILIAEVFAEVLEQEKVGLHDSFFDAGGHSLLAIQLIGRIRKAFSIDLPLKFFFENPTVQGVAETVQALQLAVQGVAVKDGEQESEAPVEEGFI
jgi:aspartate racemase